MKNVYVLLADGFEEIEALTPVDVLRRAGVNVKTVGLSGDGKVSVGSHGIPVLCDIPWDSPELSVPDMLVIPGGMPGADNVDRSPITDGLIAKTLERGGFIGAICAAPFVLGKRGYLKGRKATCFPGFEDRLIGAEYTEDKYDVIRDGSFVTSRCMGTALPFAFELAECLIGKEKRIALEKQVRAER